LSLGKTQQGATQYSEYRFHTGMFNKMKVLVRLTEVNFSVVRSKRHIDAASI